MDLCAKFRAAKSDVDRVAVLTAIPRLVDQGHFELFMAEFGRCLSAPFIVALLDEDPVETSLVAVVVLRRVLLVNDRMPALADCVPHLVACLERAATCEKIVKNADVCSESLDCLVRLVTATNATATSDHGAVWQRAGKLLVNFYAHVPEMTADAHAAIWSQLADGAAACAAGFACPLLAAIRSDLSGHVHFVRVFNAAMLARWPAGARPALVVHAECRRTLQHILTSMMRGGLPDDMRWQAVTCAYILMHSMDAQTVLHNFKFFSVAVPFAFIELQYMLDLGMIRQGDFDQFTVPILSCCGLLSAIPEAMSQVYTYRSFESVDVKGILDQALDTVKYCLQFFTTYDKEAMALPLLPVITVTVQYLLDGIELFDKTSVVSAVKNILKYVCCGGNEYNDLSIMLCSLVKYLAIGAYQLPPSDVLNTVSWSASVLKQLHPDHPKCMIESFCDAAEGLCQSTQTLRPCVDAWKQLFIANQDHPCQEVPIALGAILLAAFAATDWTTMHPTVVPLLTDRLEQAASAIARTSKADGVEKLWLAVLFEVVVDNLVDAMARSPCLASRLLQLRSSGALARCQQLTLLNRCLTALSDALDRLFILE